MKDWIMTIDQCGIVGRISYRKDGSNGIIITKYKLKIANKTLFPWELNEISFINGIFCQWCEHVEFVKI
jgi:hypothetical protein